MEIRYEVQNDSEIEAARFVSSVSGKHFARYSGRLYTRRILAEVMISWNAYDIDSSRINRGVVRVRKPRAERRVYDTVSNLSEREAFDLRPMWPIFDRDIPGLYEMVLQKAKERAAS